MQLASATTRFSTKSGDEMASACMTTYPLAMTERFESPDLDRLASAMEDFEAGASVANTGTGSRREGAKFELLAADYWHAFCDLLESEGAVSETVHGPHNRIWA